MPKRPAAFTLVELLIVISIIGIIAAMVIASYSNAAQDSRRVVALQQQAEVQGAVNNWIAAQDSVAAAKAVYADKTSLQRLALVAGYLDDTTASQFSADSSGMLVSDLLNKIDSSIELPDWTDSYPKVELHQPEAE